MEQFLAALLESLQGGSEAGMNSAMDGGMAESVAGGGMAPPTGMESLGNTIGNMGNQAIAPTMEAYKTFTNPNATSGDMLSGAYKYAFKNKEDEQMMTPPQMRIGGGMANNYVGGIPSLLQSYGGASQGILPYIGAR